MSVGAQCPVTPEVTPETIDLVGLWRLVGVSDWKNGQLKTGEAMGPRPAGYITYTAEGRMMVVLDMRSKEGLGGRYGQDPIFAYAGTYSRKGAVVTHHLEMCSLAQDAGTDYVRVIEVGGDRMFLCTEPVRKGDNTYVSKLEWVRDNGLPSRTA